MLSVGLGLSFLGFIACTHFGDLSSDKLQRKEASFAETAKQKKSVAVSRKMKIFSAFCNGLAYHILGKACKKFTNCTSDTIKARPSQRI
jgi:hypothetical protein